MTLVKAVKRVETLFKHGAMFPEDTEALRVVLDFVRQSQKEERVDDGDKSDPDDDVPD